MATVKGKANWVRIPRPDNYKNYSLTVDVGEDFIKELKAGKCSAKVQAIDHDKKLEIHGKDAQFSFTFRKASVSKAGNPQPPPTLVDTKNKPIPATVMVGNGSDLIVQYHMHPWDDAGTPRVKVMLDAIQVVNLIPYVPTKNLEFEEVEGYTADESGTI